MERKSFPHPSVFTAEAFVIYQPLEYTTWQKGKFWICSDSYSFLKAVYSVPNNLLSVRRKDICIKCKWKIALLYIPGHVGTTRNEFSENPVRSQVTSVALGMNLETMQLDIYSPDHKSHKNQSSALYCCKIENSVPLF